MRKPYLNEINELTYNGNLIEAKAFWHRKVKQHCAESLLVLIRIYNLLGQNDKSAEWLDLLEKHNPEYWKENVEYYYQKAIYYINTDQFSIGKKFIDKALEYKPSCFIKRIKILLLKSKYYAIKGRYIEQKNVLTDINRDYCLKYNNFSTDLLERPRSMIKGNKKDLLLLAEVLENYGYHAGNTHHPVASEEYHQRAYGIRLSIFADIPTHYLIARSLNNIGFCLRQNEKYEESSKHHQEAINLLIKNGFTEDNYHYFARIYFNQGVCYRQMSQYGLARERFEKVKELREKFYGTKHRYTIKAIINLATILRKQGQINSALKLFLPAKEDLIKLFKSSNHPKIAHLHNDIGYCYLIAGRYDRALIHYNKSITMSLLLIKNGEESEKITLAQTFSHIGEIHRQMKAYDKALQAHKDALSLIISRYSKKNKSHQNAQAMASMNFGMIYFDQNKYETALSFFKASEKTFKKNLSDTDARKAKLYNRIGETHLKLSKPKSANKYFRKAKNVFLHGYRKLKYPYIPVQIMELVFWANLMNKKRFFSALKDRNIVDTLIGIADSYYYRFLNSHKFISRTFLRRGLNFFIKYLEFITDEMIEDCQPEQLRRRFAEKCKRYYTIGIKIAYKLQEKYPEDKQYSADIYRLFEKSKNGILSYNLMKLKEQQLPTNENAALLKHLLEDIHSATNTMRQLEKLMSQTFNIGLPFSSKKKTNRSNRKQLKATYDNIQDELLASKRKLQENAPEYYNLKYNRVPVPYNKLRQQFKSDSVILSYFLTEENIYINIITKERCYTVRKPKVIIKDGQQIFFDDAKENFLNNFWSAIESRFQTASKEMYDWLIHPVEEYIKDINDLVIIPDESLQLFPYHALIIPHDVKTKRPTYLIEKYTIMYHYSIWFFYQNIGTLPQKDKQKLLAIAPKFFSHVQEENKLCDLKLTTNIIEALKISHKEKTIACFTEDEAIIKRLFEHSKDSDHIFIFSHGQAPNKETKQPYLIFAQNENDEKYRLYINDFVKNADLSNTSLITFCCCDSGKGPIYDGEGVVSFNKAAINLGAKAVIYTIGGASEEAALQFMLVFNQLLADGKGRRKAFQLACKALIAEGKYSARHWAVFAMIGSWKKSY